MEVSKRELWAYYHTIEERDNHPERVKMLEEKTMNLAERYSRLGKELRILTRLISQGKWEDAEDKLLTIFFKYAKRDALRVLFES